MNTKNVMLAMLNIIVYIMKYVYWHGKYCTYSFVCCGMTIPISEYRELCRALETLTASQSSLAQEMAAIRACQEQMLATQAQQATILRQLQLHFDLPPAVEPSTSIPAEPHSHP